VAQRLVRLDSAPFRLNSGESVIKYGFSIRTRGGHTVDNIVIMAQDPEAAERRLRQMYAQCEILARRENCADPRKTTYDVEALINLISRRSSVHKTGTQ
jgi:hypothetical protein